MILVIDNYDSFVFNIIRYLEEMKKKVICFRNDQITLDQIHEIKPKAILISPGPCTPLEAGVSNEVILHFGKTTPILGVCLGHQCIGHVFGGTIIRAKRPMHGKTSTIVHNARGVFHGLQREFEVTRYHSLVVAPATLPGCLDITAKSREGEIMGIQHKTYPIHGVQFHPEALLTKYGKEILKNFCNVYTSSPYKERS